MLKSGVRGVALPGECAKCRSRLAPSFDEPLSGVLGKCRLTEGGVCGSFGRGPFSCVVHIFGISVGCCFVISSVRAGSLSFSLFLSKMLLTLPFLGIRALGLARVGEDPNEEADETLVTLERRLFDFGLESGASARREEVIAPSSVLERSLAAATGLFIGDFWVFMLAKASFDLRLRVNREISACLRSLSTAALAVCCE